MSAADASTHPRSKNSKIWIILFVCLIAIGAAFYFFGGKKVISGPTITYSSIHAERGNMRVTILATGTVQPENRLEIKPPIAGRIERVLVQEGDTVYKGQILAWMSSTERAGLLDAARAKGPEEVSRWEELYQPTPIMAPIAGTIVLKSVEAGQTFANTDVVLAMSDRLLTRASVDETDIAQIHLDQRAEVTLDAYPKLKIPSKVERISFEAKTVSNVTTYTVDVLADEVPEVMRSGMTANISFIAESKTNILKLPTSALHGTGVENSVLVPDVQTGKPIEKPITTGISDGKYVEIVSGLQEGDTVMVANLKAGAQETGNTNPFAPMQSRGKSKSGGSAQPPHL